MAYEKTVWVSKESADFTEGSSPALDADHLNKMEDGIEGALQREGGVMTGDIYKDDSSQGKNRYITREQTDKLIDYLNSSPFTYKRDETGAVVVHSDVLGSGSDTYTLDCVAGNTYNVSKTSLNIFTFDFKRPSYSVPSISGVFKWESGGYGGYLLDESYFTSNYLNIKDSNGNVVATSETVNGSNASSFNMSIDLSNFPSGTYTVDYYSTLCVDWSNKSYNRSLGAGFTISLSSSYYEREIIDFVE